MGVAVLELLDPQRFNTMSWALGDDMSRAVDHVRGRRDAVRGLTIQGAGRVFCAGGNPHASSGPASQAALSWLVLDSVTGFVGMRGLRTLVVCAVYGTMVGGAAAVFLHADHRVADREATFQHYIYAIRTAYALRIRHVSGTYMA